MKRIYCKIIKIGGEKDEEIEYAKLLAEAYKKSKNKIIIKPRFLYPIAIDYIKKQYDLDLPMSFHACGAGTNFAFLNDVGVMFQILFLQLRW